MSDAVRRIADAVLYEGHTLWPYRRSALKNRQRWTFGGVYPETYARASGDRSAVQAECLLEGEEPVVEVEVRFLQAVRRQAVRDGEPVDELDGHLSWDETTERVVRVPPGARATAIAIPAGTDVEAVAGGELVRSWEPLTGRVTVDVEPLARRVHRVRVRVVNDSTGRAEAREEAVPRTFLSAHAVVRALAGELLSAPDPPERVREHAASLRTEGLWPVLVGDEDARDTILAAPIILSDYPQVAPESPGDFFDGCEIDQLLVLNILGLTDDEKREMRASDPRAREILERTEAMTPEEMLRLHGVIRDLRPVEGR
ncbi:MAG TPA: hypothetical protein VG709_08605 [Actinomycetota bacterium]|nr:hypothetical protein [Actinomycetota bacterium]